MFISLAKVDVTHNKNDFFDLNTRKPKGDFGYFNIIDHNK